MNPKKIALLVSQANVLIQQGRLPEAALQYEKICAKDPKDARNWDTLGAIYGRLNQLAKAQEACSRAVALDPNHLGAHLNLEAALIGQGKYSEAETAVRRALATHSQVAELWFRLGKIEQIQSRLVDADHAYHQALHREPSHQGALQNLASIALARNDFATAERCCLRLVELQPRSVKYLQNLAAVYQVTQRLQAAESCYRKALTLDPSQSDLYGNLGVLLSELGRYDEALENFGKARRINAENYQAIGGEAKIHLTRGEYDQAYRLLKPYIEARIGDPNILVLFASFCWRFQDCEKVIELMEQALQRDFSGYVPNPATTLHASLARLYDKKQEYDKAFHHLRTGNESMAGRFNYEQFRNEIDVLMATFNREFLGAAPRATVPTKMPIFIVGMPRSGTTLVEQILASHPQVHGAGEVRYVQELVSQHLSGTGTAGNYPQCVHNLMVADCDRLANIYLEKIGRAAGDKIRVTDKFPQNFLHLGLISLLFPQATVVHCRRSPLDTCISCYSQNFTHGQLFTRNLRTLGQYYREYHRLMEYWRSVLDIRITEVIYEELIDAHEDVVHRLVDSCELPWSDRCLNYFETDRPVLTASREQVREPIYRSSIGRWKHYAAYLDELKEALGEDLVNDS